MIQEIVLEKEIKNETSKKEKKKRKWHVEDPDVKITFIRLLAYFVIYSFLGFVVETIFGMLTKGVIESRKSCFYCPFCCIYGLGAAIMIPGLKKFKRSNWTLFIAGAIEGSVIEYVVGWIGEVIFQIKWWDYSNMPFNIHGRICILFSVFWGLLALVLIRLINPYIEILIDKIPKKIFNVTTIILTIFLLFDLLFTSFGLKVFYTGFLQENNIEMKDQRDLTVSEEILNNSVVKRLAETVFSDENVLKTFPNIKFEDKDGNIIWVKDVLTDIQPYYFKLSPKYKLK